MTSDAEIRAWARDAGHDVPQRGKVPDALRDQYDAAHAEPGNPRLPTAETPPDGGYDAAETPPTAPVGPYSDPGPVTDEVRPTPPPSRFGWKPRAQRAAPAEKPKHRRVSLEDLASGVWAALGQGAKAYGLVPTGRMLQLQAPVAGMVLEDVLRGTVVDRLAQPLARGGEGAKELAALFGMPMLTTMVTVRPELLPVLAPVMKRLMRDWAILAGPRIKAREKRERKALEALGVDEEGLDEMVDGWLSVIFAEPGAESPDGA